MLFLFFDLQYHDLYLLGHFIPQQSAFISVSEMPDKANKEKYNDRII